MSKRKPILVSKKPKMRLASLTPHPDNPRKIKDADFESLCQSLRDDPHLMESIPMIVSNRTGDFVILSGNQRYFAALEIGLKTYPTHIHQNLTPAEEEAVMFKCNLHAGTFDMEIIMEVYDPERLTKYGFEMILPSTGGGTKGKTKKKIEVTHTCPECGYQFQ